MSFVLACFAVLLGALDEGASSHYWTDCWWTALWFGPCVYSAWHALRTVRGRRGLALAFATCAAWIGLFAFEVEVGRTTASPWWLSSALVLVMLASVTWACHRARPEAGRTLRSAALVTAAFAIGWIETSRSGGFIRACLELRIRMSSEQIDEHVRSHGLLRLGEDPNEFEIRPPSVRADICYVTLADGKLASYWISPDD